MFAVIKTGGKQYRVAEDQMLEIEKIQGEPGQIIQLGDVLMLGGDQPKFGAPTISGASVAAEVLSQGRGPKIIAFKKRRRKNSRRKRGHRQEFTLIRITEILTDGAKPTKAARPKPENKPKPEAAADGEAEGEAEAEGQGRQEAGRQGQEAGGKAKSCRQGKEKVTKRRLSPRILAKACEGSDIKICEMIPTRNRGTTSPSSGH